MESCVFYAATHKSQSGEQAKGLMMFKFLPLAFAATLIGALPVSAVTTVKVDPRSTTAAAQPDVAQAHQSTLFAATGPDSANWAFLFGGVALIASLRLGRRRGQVSN
jgi:hypothetical protein